MRKSLSVAVVLGALALGAGCTPVGVVVGAGAVAGSTALQERGIEQAFADAATELSIQKKIIDKDLKTFQRIGFAVVEGRVLLTGIVPNAEDRGRVIQLAWQTPGVSEVINEVLIGEDVGLADTAFDAKIATSLELDLTLDRDVQAINYTLQPFNGTVFLMGVAQDQTELDRVIAHARNVERVRRIVSYVHIKDSPTRLANLERLEELKAEQAAREAAEPSEETSE